MEALHLECESGEGEAVCRGMDEGLVIKLKHIVSIP